MSNKSAIEWTNMTWNPVVGCTRVTEGCEHCYAFTLHDQRYNVYQRNQGLWQIEGKTMPAQYAKPFSVVQLLKGRLEAPLREKRPKMIFVNSMSDLFHSAVPDAFIGSVFEVMRQAHWHTFQVLTKRPGRLRHLAHILDWPTNVWIGVSIENDRFTARADALRSIPAAVRFLSCEPLLGPLPSLRLNGLDWVIAGGESGPGARPLQEEWVVALRDRCTEAEVPFFFKQWGGRTPKAGGRLLQGKLWDEYPLVDNNARSI